MKTDSANGQQPTDNSQQPKANGQQPKANSFSLGSVIRVGLITLVLLLLLLVVAASVLLWVVFTPERLTPIVQKQLDKHSPYQASIEKVELTFFSTFPQFSIHIEHLLVISPFPEAPSDTLLKAGNLAGTIDIRALWKDNEIILNKLHITNGFANVYIDSLGLSNYALLLSIRETETDEQAELPFQLIHLKEISFFDTDLSFIDHASGIQTQIHGLQASLSGTFRDNIFDGKAAVEEAYVSFSSGDEKYLSNDIVSLDLPVRLVLSEQQAAFRDAFVSVNGLGVALHGAMGFDVDHGTLSLDIHYEGKPWIIQDLLALIPPAYLEPLGAFTADGKLTASGVIRGILADTLSPVVDARLIMEDGGLTYELIPFPLSGINGEAYLFLDMNTPTITYLDIARMEASSPASRFKTKGRVDELLGDIRLNLTTEANALLEEFRDYIPPGMELAIHGRANGRIYTNFSISDAMDLKLENMIMNGSFMLSDFSINYDTISVRADRSLLDFSMPNKSPHRNTTGFARVDINSDTLSVVVNNTMAAGLKNAHLVLEMSDMRDTTAVPDVYATYTVSMLHVLADTIEVSVSQPRGLLSVTPGQEFPKQPVLYLEYMSDRLEARAGNDMAETGNTWIISNIVNDASQDDKILQWAATGFLNMRDGLVSLTDLASPLEIPAVRMDFEPEIFTIHEGRMKLGQSDFELSGLVRNVFSYVRGDSLLRGHFVFASDHTDLAQLMSLTSGIGAVEEDENENSEESFSGPYMVPMGIDLSIDARVKQAVFGPDTISNIRGEVRVRDGILVFDGIDFTSPAADMRLTAMYRTPRKNHLYLGIDYHMFDIDISRLLQMIPDIDTLMPMLRSFQGNGEFHMAIETYLDSLYNIKKSTLRGASSIRGQDLVLLDGETFSEIAKTLRFSRRAENRVDSLAAEFTIFREEIDIYPFLIVMDRYQAVVGGRHNFDMSFNYHISLVDSPLPVRLGIDVTGTLDKMNYRLASPKYAELYRPVSRRAVESRQLEFRRMIREALMQNID